MSQRDRLSASAISTTIIPIDPEKKTLPDSIQWMPPGRQNVMPIVNGEPMSLVFDVTPEIADSFNRQLQEMRAAARAGEGDEPYIDFNHDDKERAGEVLEFYWGGDDAKTGGIRARISWSAAGGEAVLGKNYRRFSPQWDFDPNTHKPLFISENLGGLVNRAAFKKIAQVIAKDGSASTSTTKQTMTDAEFKQIVADALKPIGDRLNTLETRLPAAPTSAAARGAENNQDIAAIVGKAVGDAIKPYSDKLDKVEGDSKKALARAAINPHIQRGAIAPQDADTIGMWETAWLANAKSAEAQMAKLPGAKGGRITNPTSAQEAMTETFEPQDAIMAKAHEMVSKSGGRLKLDEALLAVARSAEGEESYKEFRSTFALGKAKAKNN